MRPWTVVVLSEHGRDRWAFRDSERLFSPNLDRLSLPVFNPYVLRIQATWFLVDWIARKVGRTPAQVVLRWHVERGDIVFPKSVNRERMEENLALFDFARGSSDVQALSALDRGEKGRRGPNPDQFDYIPR